MDMNYLQFSTQMYAVCFKQVFSQFKEEAGETEETQMNQCLSNFVKSYQTVTASWIDHAAYQPDKDRYSPPNFEE